MITFTIILFCFGLFSPLPGKHYWDVITVGGKAYSHVQNLDYQQPYLIISWNARTDFIHRNSIDTLIKKRKAQFGVHFLAGTLIGAVAGRSLGKGKGNNPAVVIGNAVGVIGGAVVGGLIGGFVGLLAQQPEVYTLRAMSLEDRERFLNHFRHSGGTNLSLFIKLKPDV